MQEKNLKRRFRLFLICIIVSFSVFFVDLFRIQIVHAADNTSQRIAMSSVESTIPAARGEILDRNGVPLVTNQQVNSVYINAQYFPSTKQQEERNAILQKLIHLAEKYGVAWNDNLPLELDEKGNVRFKPDSESEIAFLKSKAVLHLNSYATAENCFTRLVEKFKLEEYPKADALKIASVCYSFKKISFSADHPFVFADEVTDEFAAKIEENRTELRGVEVKITTKRHIADGTIAPHIIGLVGKLDANEYTKHKNEYNALLEDESLTDAQKKEAALRAYSMDDTIGKFGLEAAMEDYLRGTNGIMTTVTDSNGYKTSEITRAPVAGNSIILTIDSVLQKKVQDALANFAETYSLKETGVPPVGSAVVMDVKTGGILACATYPSYDLNTYYDNYAALSKDKASPLWNRALKSTYAPGSTLKPAIALAGLEENVINEKTKINCTRIYQRFPDMNFKCLQIKHSGNIDVRTAIFRSCNIFFYETGFNLGIDRMNDYCTRFGLGQKTGIEIPESKGVLASRAYKESHGQIWHHGDTVQAAIGQSDNLFTPLQLASYVSTLANGGTRYQAHFVKSIKSSDYENTILTKDGTVLGEVGASKKNIDVVTDGMHMLGANTRAFKDLPVQVAAKTGTAQFKLKIDGRLIEGTNGFMISFAPYENPEIAVVVAVENLDGGAVTAILASEIYKAYFEDNSTVTPEQGYNTVLR